jgi:hypothetical protein
MGRLTLNVLLSFAQFEREVTGERIRDKIAASKKKGMWMGGVVPLGYNVKDRRLIINAEEAEIVRFMFQRYLELGSVRALQEDMISRNMRSKFRMDQRRAGGNFMSRGAIYQLLSNRIYIGQIHHKGSYYQGQHEAIIDQALWDKVQQHMADNAVEHRTRLENTALLNSKLFDVSGERLRSANCTKRGRRYRYYVSLGLLTGTRAQNFDGWRLPGKEIEKIVAYEAIRLLKDRNAITTALQELKVATPQIPAALTLAETAAQPDTEIIIKKFIQRVELRQDRMRITFSLASLVSASTSSTVITRDIPMKMKRRGVEMRLVVDNHGPARIDPTLIKTVACAHKWWKDVLSGMSITAIAVRDGVDRAHVNKRLALVFLAPEIIESIIAGRQPADLLTEKLVKRVDLPLDWVEQRRILGFN